MSDTPIFHEVLSSEQWKQPKPEPQPAPLSHEEKWRKLAEEYEAAGLDMDEPWPTEAKKPGRKKKI